MGRGSSKAGGSGGNLTALTKGIYTEGSPGAYEKEATEVIKGFKDVLSDFGMEDQLRGIYFSNSDVTGRDHAMASMNGMGDLRISPSYLKEGNKSTKGWNVSDTYYGTGTHEAGHAVVRGLLDKVEISGDAKSQNLIKATARKEGKLEKAVIKEAKRRNGGSNPPISGYATKGGPAEKVAEAFSDVYTNGSKANPYSKIIVDVCKDVNNGSFKPKLSVTRREMGI